MNVLQIDEQRGWRGGELQTSWIIRGLAARGHTVIVAGRPGSAFLGADYGIEGLPRIAAPFWSEGDLWTVGKLARAVRDYRVDILHAQTSHAHMMACLARGLAGRGKVVVSRRVSFPPKGHVLNRWKYALPDRFIAVSEGVKKVLVEWGVSALKIAVVHSSVDPNRLAVKPVPRADLRVLEGAPLIGNLGALVGHKDHATLIAAVHIALGDLPNLHVVIAGEGELRPAIERQIQEFGLAGRVVLLGHRDDAPRILRALDVYVSSSWSEGLGTSVLEALACGIPVVATDAGGMCEMVIHEKTGLLVPARDPRALAAAIVRIFRETNLAREMAENGKAHVQEHFTVEKMVEGNLRVYERLL